MNIIRCSTFAWIFFVRSKHMIHVCVEFVGQMEFVTMFMVKIACEIEHVDILTGTLSQIANTSHCVAKNVGTWQ